MKKKWMVLVAAVVVALGSLSGCGEREANSDRVEIDMSENLEDAEREEDAKKSYGMREVTVEKKHETYYYDGRLEKSIEYEYDEKGNMIGTLVKEKEVQSSAAGGDTSSTEEYSERNRKYKFDEYGNSIDKCKNEYDLLGNMIKKTCYDSDGNVYFWWEYEYDSQGSKVKRTEYDSDGSTTGYWVEYEYDRRSGVTKAAGYRDGRIEWQEEVDENGNEIKLEEYINGGKIQKEFDEKGNALKYIEYVNMGGR